jgi:hypothetical protein
MRDERPLRHVAPAIWVALAVALTAQVAWRSERRGPDVASIDLPPAPSSATLRLASFGEPEALARTLMLYLQAYDYHGTNATPYARLDYRRLVQWLEAILALDPRSEYPLMAAARVYAETGDRQRSRMALDFVHRQFLADPQHRWPWLAHAALLAKHRLHDLTLARSYAAEVAAHTRNRSDVPLWAKQMEIFVLEDMNELEAARIMLGGLLESGAVTDPGEALYLQLRLRALEERSRKQ